MKKTSKAAYFTFKTVRCLVRLFYGKATVVGMEKLPENNAVIVGNHSKMNGPIVGELFFPENCYTWCAGQMMEKKEVPEYAFNDFWSGKPKWTHPFYRLLSHIIAPLAYSIFNNARTVAVYHDTRIISTFKQTVNMLKEDKNIIIFPEKGETRNNIVNQFQENFVDVARLYHKKTGIELSFVPIYIAPRLRKIYIGDAIKFNSENDIKNERTRIAEYLAEEITKIGRELPTHTVVPYGNIPKKRYLKNKDITEVPQ